MKNTTVRQNTIATLATTALLMTTQWLTASSAAIAQVDTVVDVALDTVIEAESKRSTLASASLAKSNQMRGPDGDFSVWMPGEITRNTSEALISYSPATGTTYGMLHFDLDYSMGNMTYDRLSDAVYEILAEIVNRKGVVIDSQGYEINGLPVWEVTSVEADGNRAKHRLFVRGHRVYYRFAVTSTRFSAESRDFFSSFSLARL